MRSPVRKLDQEMPTNHSVTIRNCYIENCETGVCFFGVQNALIDGLQTKNVRKPIVDRRGRRNTYHNLYFEIRLYFSTSDRLMYCRSSISIEMQVGPLEGKFAESNAELADELLI